jgi:hypothetical protein
MSSRTQKQQFKSSKAKKLSTPPVQTYAMRTRSGKILAMTEPEPQSDQDFAEAGTDFVSFTKLHTLVYEVISDWATHQPAARKHKFYQLWLTAWRDSIQATSTYHTVKQKLHLKSMADYKEHVLQCPAIIKHFDISLNHTGDKIRYTSIPQIVNKDSSDITSPEVSLAEEDEAPPPTYADMMDERPDEDAENTTTPNLKTEPEEMLAANTTDTFDMSVTAIADTPMVETQQSNDELKKPVLDNIESTALQELLIDIEEETSPAGTTTHQNRFFHWMADRLNHRMGQIGNYLKDAKIQLDDKIAKINTDICVMEATVKQMEANIENFATSMDTIVINAQKQLNQARIQAEHHMNPVEQKMENMNTTISETCQYFESQVKSYCKKEEEDLRETISEAIVHLTQEAINENVNPVLQDHLKAIELTANEAITELKKESLKCSSYTSTPSQKLPPTPWSQRGPDAPDASNARVTSTVSTHQHRHRDRWGQMQPNTQVKQTPYAPAKRGHTTRPSHPSNPYIIPCNHNDFIKKAQIRYTGKIFTFYNKLRNVGRQYGIYLQALDDIKYEASLCPTSHNGHTFTDLEYEDMAATLYEKLDHIDVIPEQYSRYRSIIDRYVDTNDGYLVLYEMLEDEHPAMQQDPIQRTPTSNECQDDIQEYSARFTSYLMSENLNGRTYRAREQVVLFLKGLDTEFAPAVQYVETLMDSWGKDGLNPKCELRYLPRTIEAFMKTHAESTPTMRVTKLHDVTTEDFIEMIRAATSRDGPKKGKQDSTEGPRKICRYLL